MSNLSENDKTQMIDEAFDLRKLHLYCGKHMYFGPSESGNPVKPALGCSDCWKVFFIHEIASTPPSKRAEVLDKLEENLRKSAELASVGEFDFQVYDHPKIEIAKD